MKRAAALCLTLFLTLACAAALALAVAACGLDSTMGATLKATAASLFAGSGPRVTIPAHALLPTPFLLGACGASLVAAVLAAVGRRIRP